MDVIRTAVGIDEMGASGAGVDPKGETVTASRLALMESKCGLMESIVWVICARTVCIPQ